MGSAQVRVGEEPRKKGELCGSVTGHCGKDEREDGGLPAPGLCRHEVI